MIFCNVFVYATSSPYSDPPKTKSFIDCLPPSSMATIQPIKNGLWYQTSTWANGILPTSNDDVVVPVGINLIMAGTCRAKSITVKGKLSAVNWQAAGAWINLETQSIMVVSNGLLEIGTAAQPYFATGKCTITLKGAKVNNAPAAYKGIMVMDNGRLELHGKTRKSWTNIATTANAGATQITLKEAVNWEIGDKIALTSTGLANAQTKAWNHVDEAEISAISQDKKTFTLKTPLNYKHIGGSKTYTRAKDGKSWDVDIFGEVGLLSHYIKIQSDETNDDRGFGGHVMLMPGSTAHVEHVEFYKMGQKAILGRYPFHWHLNEDKAQGSYIKNSSIHKSYNRAVTIHGTDYVTVDGVFAYDHIGHGIFFEDGGERFNTIKNNVVFITRRPKQGEELTPSDNEFNQAQNRTPSSYWITNPNNYFENNVAAGTEGTGFWFAFPENGPLFATGQLNYFQGIIPWKEPLGSFDGFVIHSCMNGFDLFDRLNNDHSIKANWGWNISTNQYLENGLFYANDQAIYTGLGVGGDVNKVVYRNCAFSDNKVITMLASDITIQNSLFNVDTDLGVFSGTREFYRFYDGPGRHINCHFEGWNRDNALFMQQREGAGATENFNPTFIGTTKGFSEPFPFTYVQLNANARTRKTALGFKDYDGGLLGKAHTTLVRDIAFYRDGHEYRHPSWKNMARSDYYLANLWLHNMGNDPAIAIQRVKPGTANACIYEPGATTGTYKAGLFVNEGFTYNYYLSKLPSNKKIHLIWYRGDTGDRTLVNFKGLGKLTGFSVSGSNIQQLNSKSAVEASQNLAYYIAGNGDVYVQLKAKGGNNRTNVFFNWNGVGNYTKVPLPCTSNDFAPDNSSPDIADSDGDGYTDEQEEANCRSALDPSDLSFDFDNTNENFTLNKIASTNLTSNGNWQLIAENSNDPFVVRKNLSFSANAVPSISVRMRSEKAGVVQLFWAINGSAFSGTRRASANYATANQWQEVTFNLSSNAQWSDKTITALRFDLVADTNNTVNHWIDWLRGPNGEDAACDSPKIVHLKKRNAPNYAIDGNHGGTNGQNTYLWSANANNVNQQWLEISHGNGYYSYQKQGTNYCIDGKNGGTNGQNVHLWTCNESNLNQQWKKVEMESGFFRLEKRNAPNFSINGGNGGANGQNVSLTNSSSTSHNLQWNITYLNTASTNSKQFTRSKTDEILAKSSIYPNPVSSILNIELSHSGNYDIINFAGQTVLSNTAKKGSNKVDLSTLSNGMYIVKITNGQQIQFKKIIKQ